MKKIKCYAPATVANVVCGYDVLGFAIDNPGDEVIVSFNNNNKTVITKIEGDQESYRLMPIKTWLDMW